MYSRSPHDHSTRPAALRTERRARAWNARPLLFWLSFFALNFLIFLPAFVFSSEGQALLPPLDNDWLANARRLLAWRDNLDPWRLSAELTLLAVAWVFVARLRRGRLRRPFLFLFSATFLLALAYNIYESLSIFFYQEDPVFFAQAQLIGQGLPFVARHLNLSPPLLLGAGAVAATAVALLLLLLRLFFAPRPDTDIGISSRALLFALATLVIASFFFNGRALAGPKSVVSCLGCKLERNLSDSLAAAAQVQAVNRQAFDQVYDYGRYALVKQPDIYLIFVESYGSILYQRGHLRTPYLALLDELQGTLDAGGWQVASIMSESPTWGGGSWMAYTSALFGLRVDTHPAYLALQERFPNGGYPHLGATLQKMGYEHARVTSIAVELGQEQWQRYKSFYGVDRWLQYSDLGYSGPHYGWGPAPPDQYVLNAANERLQASGKPLLFFMITQNSHYPWQETPPLVADWRALNDGSGDAPAPNLKTPKVTVELEDYLATIDYELRYLTQFISQEADREALFILIGDHQPGYITRKADGYDTPLHIISRDEALIASLSEYGFAPGLAIADRETRMKHEGLYSLLMRVLLDRYGRGDRLPPAYLPDGVPLS